MLWFCKWLDRTSLLVDHGKREGAIVIATDCADGEPPESVALVPEGVFRAEVIDGDDSDHVAVEVDPGTIFVLTEIEDHEPGDTGGGRCTSEADTDAGETVVCMREAGHGAEHEALGLVWK